MKPFLLIFGFAMGSFMSPGYGPEVEIIEREVFVIIDPPPIPNARIPLRVNGSYPEGFFE